MTLEEALDKVRKLLRLAESDNANEAALAAARAQSILDRYEIDKAMLELDAESIEPEEEIENFKNEPLDEATKFNLDKWRIRLAALISENNMCRAYTLTNADTKRTILIGRKSDVQKVRYLFSYFAREVDRLCDRDGKGYGRTWRNNYRHGVIDTLNNTIKQERETSIKKLKGETTSTALVRLTDALDHIQHKMDEVNAWTEKNIKLKNPSKTRMTQDYSARILGRMAGHEIQISNSRGALSK